MKEKDAYKILGLDKGASEEEIKSAYHNLARKYHPDKRGVESKEVFQNINKAYKILTNDTDVSCSESESEQNSIGIIDLVSKLISKFNKPKEKATDSNININGIIDLQLSDIFSGESKTIRLGRMNNNEKEFLEIEIPSSCKKTTILGFGHIDSNNNGDAEII